MTISKSEKALSFVIKDPRFPMTLVEGTFKGERRVFLCLVDAKDEKDPAKGYTMTPVATLIGEGDFRHIRDHKGDGLGGAAAPDIIISKG
jgi:hypothetical protein